MNTRCRSPAFNSADYLTSKSSSPALDRYPLFVHRCQRFFPLLVLFVIGVATSSSGGKPWIMASAAAAMSTVSANKAACSVIPRLGLGTFIMESNQIPKAISSSINLGYKRIDCAPVYFNEEHVGDALQSALTTGMVNRDDLFVVSKLPNCFHREKHVEMALKKTLADLRLDYLDLYLIHWPTAFQPVLPIPMDKRGWENEDIDESGDGERIDTTVSIHETWRAMEQLVDMGLVKNIGVSNFPVSLLHELMTRATIPPLVNQVEAHPYLQQAKLLKYMLARGVHFQAFSPLGTPGFKEAQEPNVMDDRVLKSLALKHNVTVAQICLTWAIQRGTSVVAKSVSAERQAENINIFKSGDEEELLITLTDDDMAQVASLERGYRYFRPEEWWPKLDMAVFD
jgi:alcohol dehydrogenase (NADP+)